MSDQSRAAIDNCIAVVKKYLSEEQIRDGKTLVPKTTAATDKARKKSISGLYSRVEFWIFSFEKLKKFHIK